MIAAGERFIRARRGLIAVLDRARLEAYVPDFYGMAEAAHTRLIAPLRRMPMQPGSSIGLPLAKRLGRLVHV